MACYAAQPIECLCSGGTIVDLERNRQGSSALIRVRRSYRAITWPDGLGNTIEGANLLIGDSTKVIGLRSKTTQTIVDIVDLTVLLSSLCDD